MIGLGNLDPGCACGKEREREEQKVIDRQADRKTDRQTETFFTDTCAVSG